ncbi:collagen alpha-2(IV) chain-like [Oscarella lobularis]|uniref:collagen alpha-2(IV) chain-like n=1 Tax=Oscarella lobularis TaxID=121494 RepID=UPI0033137CAB
MLFIAILVAGAMLANCSYTGILVRHSQSSVHIPSCPSGYTRLWDGYSFMGSAAIRGNGNGQDLSSPGSCLKNFRTIAAAQCYGSSLCEHYQTGDFSVWLWGRDHLQASHCVVCEGPYTHIAVHSQTASYPSRPSGWRSAWSGYSFVEFQLIRGAVGGSADLRKSGSCLPHHESVPFLECQDARCKRITGSDKSYWLSTRRYNEPHLIGEHRPMISGGHTQWSGTPGTHHPPFWHGALEAQRIAKKSTTVFILVLGEKTL